jgi:hypothetical protein
MKTCGGVDVYLHACITLALNKDEWLASGTNRFTLSKESPVPIGQEAGVDTVEKKSSQYLSDRRLGWTLWRRVPSTYRTGGWGGHCGEEEFPVPIGQEDGVDTVEKKSSQYLSDRRLGWTLWRRVPSTYRPGGWGGHCGEEGRFMLLQGIEPRSSTS